MLLKHTALICLSAVALTAGVGVVSGAWAAATFGGALALLGGLFGLWLLVRGLRRELAAGGGTSHVFGAVVGGMAVRMVLLGIGLALSVVLWELSPLTFVAAFFLVHLVSQLIEIRYAHRAGQAGAAAAS